MPDVEDRSAGRWCGFCAHHGSHHTDRHDEFMSARDDQLVADFRAKYHPTVAGVHDTTDNKDQP